MSAPILTHNSSFSLGVAGIDTTNTPTQSSEVSSESIYVQKINDLKELLKKKNLDSIPTMKSAKASTTENKTTEPVHQQVAKPNSATEPSAYGTYVDRHGTKHFVPLVPASSQDNHEVMPSPQICLNNSNDFLSSRSRLATANRTNEICRNFVRGFCQWGRRCCHVHISRELQVLEDCAPSGGIEKKIIFTDATINEICRPFGERRCAFGRSCHRIHVVNCKGPLPTTPQPDSSSCSSTQKIAEGSTEHHTPTNEDTSKEQDIPTHENTSKEQDTPTQEDSPKEPDTPAKEDTEYPAPIVSLPTMTLQKLSPEKLVQPQAQSNTSIKVEPLPSSHQTNSVRSRNKQTGKAREAKASKDISNSNSPKKTESLLVPPGLVAPPVKSKPVEAPLVPPGLTPPRAKGEIVEAPPGLPPPRVKGKAEEVPLVPPGLPPPRAKGKATESATLPKNGPGKAKASLSTTSSDLVADKDRQSESQSKAVNNTPSDLTYNWSAQTDAKAWLDSDTAVSEFSVSSSELTLSSATSLSDEDKDQKRVRHPRPRNSGVCWRWLRGTCERTYDCRFVHEDLEYDEPVIKSESTPKPTPSTSTTTQKPPSMVYTYTLPSEPTLSSATSLSDEDKDQKRVRHPRPRNSSVCRRWLNGKCERTYDCNYIHEDLEYDEPVVITTQKIPSMVYTYTLHDHIKVKYAAGFAIQEIITGFESPWLYINSLPSHVTESDISYLLSRHGTVQDLRIMHLRSKGMLSARARFASTVEARNANTSLNGSVQWGTTISTQLPVGTSKGPGARIQDTAVRIDWEAPSIVGFAGYPTHEQADKALKIVNAEYRDTFISAVMHVGLPAVGKYTVRFMNLPLSTTEVDMKRYAEPADMMWNEPNYTSVEGVVNTLKFILSSNQVDLLNMDVSPPPYRDGRVRAWAYFSSAAEARMACSLFHMRKLKVTGRTRMYAHHLQTLSYSIPLEEYRKIEADVFSLKRHIWAQGKRHTTLGVVVGESTVIAKLSGEDTRELGQLKAEFEKIRGGELVVVRKENEKEKEVVWDGFFGSFDGRTWLRQLERTYQGVVIREDVFRRRLTLFGHPEGREAVKKEILEKYRKLNSRIPRYISLAGGTMGPFMRSKLPGLQRAIGTENITMDLRNQQLVIMGTKKDYQVAVSAVQELRVLLSANPMARRDKATCPVCFGPADGPITLDQCGHTYCKNCLKGYLQASVENNAFFPITCLGNEASCDTPIPLSVARQVLEPGEFDAVVGAAFRSHIHSHTKEFHYCPSPDCMQIYRTAPEGNVLQCPSCLVRICGKCHVEYHDGFDCPDRDGEEKLFKEWAEKHGVKRCPECKVPIERSEGCNHVTCTQCGTHICWVCMDTFPKGEGIYSHMRAEHGGIGLATEEWY